MIECLLCERPTRLPRGDTVLGEPYLECFALSFVLAFFTVGDLLAAFAGVVVA